MLIYFWRGLPDLALNDERNHLAQHAQANNGRSATMTGARYIDLPHRQISPSRGRSSSLYYSSISRKKRRSRVHIIDSAAPSADTNREIRHNAVADKVVPFTGMIMVVVVWQQPL